MGTEESVTHPAARFVGAAPADWEMGVERGKVAAFATATGSNSAEYRAPEAPVPPTLTKSIPFWRMWSRINRVSLVWIAIVATTRSLRMQGHAGWATGLIVAGTIAVLLVVVLLWRTVRTRKIRRIPV